MMKSSGNFQGQIVLITVLVLTIAMTVALSLIGRATTDVGMSAQLEDSARAFSAAEAGIEKALKTNIGETATQLANGEIFTSVVTAIGGGSTVYEPDQVTKKGETETIWLVHHNADGTLNETDPNSYSGPGTSDTIDICWQHGSAPLPDFTPAISVTVYYYSVFAGYQVSREAFDPAGALRNNNFDYSFNSLTDGCGKIGTVYFKRISFDPLLGRPLFLRITPYYQDAKLLFAPMTVPLHTFPDQGVEVSSTGSTAGGITRKIVVKRQYLSPSSLFDHVVYSQNGL